jgi:hypothetical protein
MKSVDQVPHVVLVGGYLTMPAFYWPLRRRLLERGAARVSIAQIYWPDWFGITVAGFGPVLLRGARAIREARGDADAPLLVVGHSAGGIVSRLAMSPEPLDGRVAGVANDIGCLVTLGTPHRLYDTIPGWDHPGLKALRFLDRVSPGAWFAPTTSYVTVGSVFVDSDRRGPSNPLKQGINGIMRKVVGQTPGVGSDGIVSSDLTRLDGARHVQLERALHGTFGAPWYGNEEPVDRWWPIALEEWNRALVARDRAPVDG